MKPVGTNYTSQKFGSYVSNCFAFFFQADNLHFSALKVVIFSSLKVVCVFDQYKILGLSYP